MPVRLIDKATYLGLIEAFRRTGPNMKGVAKQTGLSRGMVKRAYDIGWTHRYEWARPIVTVLAEDSAEVRARLHEDVEVEEERLRLPVRRRDARRKVDIEQEQARQEKETEEQIQAARAAADAQRAEMAEKIAREREELVRRRSEAETAQEAEREKARQQAVEARTQEAQLVRLSRGAAIGTLGGTMRLMPALAKLADQLRAAVDAGQIPVDKAASTINTIARTVREATVAAQVVIELERLHVGAPQAIIGVMQHEVALDEAALAVEEFQAAIDRSRQLGIVQPTTISVGPKKGAT